MSKKVVISAILAVSLFLFILSFSISLPIYVRPFYYAHIDAMDLPSQSGFTESEIKQAYDDVLDYLTLPDKEFKTGVMKHSAEGAAHFADCKVLFDLNAEILLMSSLCLLVLFVLRKKQSITTYHSVPFYTSLTAIILPLVIGGLAALNFDRAFVIFHKIFFPGKDNWLFDPVTDEIIQVLPQQFFLNCGILIAVSIVTLSVTTIIISKKRTS